MAIKHRGRRRKMAINGWETWRGQNNGWCDHDIPYFRQKQTDPCGTMIQKEPYSARRDAFFRDNVGEWTTGVA